MQHAWSQGKCPTIGSVCSYGHKPNHWAAVCKNHNKSAVSVEQERSPEDEILTIGLTAEYAPVAVMADDRWIVDIEVLSKELEFRCKM